MAHFIWYIEWLDESVLFSIAVDFAIPNKGESLIAAYQKWRNWADPKVCCDYALHVAVSWWSPDVHDEMKVLSDLHGINSFKVYLAYKGWYDLDDTEMFECFERCRELGALALVHAENGSIIAKNTEKLLRAGITGPEGHALSRSEEVESEAVYRSCVIAHQVCDFLVSHCLVTCNNVLFSYRPTVHCMWCM